MNALKSLKEFDNESNVLTSNELKTISGGLKSYFTIVTGSNGGDRRGMCQNYIFDGTSYVADGPAYATGPAYDWP